MALRKSQCALVHPFLRLCLHAEMSRPIRYLMHLRRKLMMTGASKLSVQVIAGTISTAWQSPRHWARACGRSTTSRPGSPAMVATEPLRRAVRRSRWCSLRRLSVVRKSGRRLCLVSPQRPEAEVKQLDVRRVRRKDYVYSSFSKSAFSKTDYGKDEQRMRR